MNILPTDIINIIEYYYYQLIYSQKYNSVVFEFNLKKNILNAVNQCCYCTDLFDNLFEYLFYHHHRRVIKYLKDKL